MVAVSVWRSLRRPREQLRSFDAARPTLARLPYDVWGRFTAIALVGSALYGASLSLVLPGWRALGGALWMGLSAGLSWCIFWPALALLARRSFFSVAHACLVSIAYGEAVLVSGAIGNLLLRFRAARRPNPTAYNWGVVGLANVLMAALLTRQLGALGVPARKTLLAWLAILDGGGIALFWLLRRLPRAPLGK